MKWDKCAITVSLGIIVNRPGGSPSMFLYLPTKKEAATKYSTSSMSYNKDSSSVPTVKRTARLNQQGLSYTLKLLENGESKKVVLIESPEDAIDNDLEWRDEEGDVFPGAKYKVVTKGSSFIFQENKYLVKNQTPFEASASASSPPALATTAHAYELKFTIISNHLQADGLRKLLTQSAHRNSAFYPAIYTDTCKNAEEMHDKAFKSLQVPTGADLTGWEINSEGEAENAPQLLSVHLIFLGIEKASAFKGEVLELLRLRPSSRVFDAQLKSLSPTSEEGIHIRIQTAMVPILPHAVYEHHCLGHKPPTTPPNDLLDWCDLTTMTSATLSLDCVGTFSTNDPLWPFQVLKHKQSFRLHAEKAHIFPHKECIKYEKKKQGRSKIKLDTGYEWLDNPLNAEFNFLYLSKDMRVSFDGSGNGRAPTDAAQPAICIEPEARTIKDSKGVKRFGIKYDDTTKETRATIPLLIWCKSVEVATVLNGMLSPGTELHRDTSTNLPYFSNISIHCVHCMIHMEPKYSSMEIQDNMLLFIPRRFRSWTTGFQVPGLLTRQMASSRVLRSWRSASSGTQMKPGILHGRTL